MTSERWARVKALFQAAVERPPQERAAFLAAEASDDTSLGLDVEALLAMDDDEADVLEGFSLRPAALSVGAMLSDVEEAPARPLLSPGHRIGAYEVVELLGAGAMGQVYRTRDTTLHRDVAIKVIAPSLAMDPDRLARFRREAQLLAALNHPNVAAIHGVEDMAGTPALVLELIEGPTLAARIAAGALPVSEALHIGRQIADGLEAAHAQGIVHRDLKPTNIHVRSDGVVKILDFGLARSLVVEPARTSSDDVVLAALEPGATRDGMILGTAGYMSPEQARGRAVDTRADVWAFGCVLFEMLTGRRAFDGETATDVLASVVTAEPEWSGLPATLPGSVRSLLRRCLTKDPRRRLQAIGDARIELDDAIAGVSTVDLAPEARTKARWAWLGAVAVLAASVAGLAMNGAFRAPTPARVTRTVVPLPENTYYYRGGTPAYRLGLSPDGTRLAFAASSPSGSTFQLWVRPLDSLTAVPLPGSEMTSGRFNPTWSPDGQFIAYVAEGHPTTVKKISASGGLPVTLGEVDGRDNVGGVGAGSTWSQHDVILFGADGSVAGPIRRVSANGGEVSVVISPDASKGEAKLWHPHFLPDGNHFLFLAVGPLDGIVNRPLGLYVSSLDRKERKLIMAGGSNAKYVNGHLLFIHESTLMAQRFDVERLALSGEAVAVAAHIQTGGPTGTTGAYAVSQTGVLAYIGGNPLGIASLSQLTWLDREGRALGTLGDPAVYRQLELSGDAARLVVDIDDEASRTNLWMFDIARGLRTKFTFALGGLDPVFTWAPDDKRVVFSRFTVPNSLFFKSADGSGGEEEITRPGQPMVPRSWRRDGRYLALDLEGDIGVMRFGGEPQVSTLFESPAIEASPRFSPDGRWIAYLSDESGRPEVFVSPFPGPGPRVRISTAGGTQPRWRADGRELLYISASDNKLMAAAVNGTGSAFAVGTITALFDVSRRAGARNPYSYQYDVMPDGKRFLFNYIVRQQELNTPITIVTNWDAALGVK